jgi:hypothetical protein
MARRHPEDCRRRPLAGRPAVRPAGAESHAPRGRGRRAQRRRHWLAGPPADPKADAWGRLAPRELERRVGSRRRWRAKGGRLAVRARHVRSGPERRGDFQRRRPAEPRAVRADVGAFHVRPGPERRADFRRRRPAERQAVRADAGARHVRPEPERRAGYRRRWLAGQRAGRAGFGAFHARPGPERRADFRRRRQAGRQAGRADAGARHVWPEPERWADFRRRWPAQRWVVSEDRERRAPEPGGRDDCRRPWRARLRACGMGGSRGVRRLRRGEAPGREAAPGGRPEPELALVRRRNRALGAARGRLQLRGATSEPRRAPPLAAERAAAVDMRWRRAAAPLAHAAGAPRRLGQGRASRAPPGAERVAALRAPVRVAPPDVGNARSCHEDPASARRGPPPALAPSSPDLVPRRKQASSRPRAEYSLFYAFSAPSRLRRESFTRAPVSIGSMFPRKAVLVDLWRSR